MVSQIRLVVAILVIMLAVVSRCCPGECPSVPIGSGVWVNSTYGTRLELFEGGVGVASPMFYTYEEACADNPVPTYFGRLKWFQDEFPRGLDQIALVCDTEGSSTVYQGTATLYSLGPGGTREDPWSMLLMFPCGDPDTTNPIVFVREDSQ